MSTKVTLYNRSDRNLEEFIFGALVRIPKQGNAILAESQAAAMEKIYPKELSRLPAGQYTEEDVAFIRTLPADAVTAICVELMQGRTPDLAPIRAAAAKKAEEKEKANAKK